MTYGCQAQRIKVNRGSRWTERDRFWTFTSYQISDSIEAGVGNTLGRSKGGSGAQSSKEESSGLHRDYKLLGNLNSQNKVSESQ